MYAALILAGEPINNRRLAELMDRSPGEASRRVAQLEGVIRKARKGREVMIIAALKLSPAGAIRRGFLLPHVRRPAAQRCPPP